MEKLMVVIFDNETNTNHGIRALKKLNDEGNITIHEGARIHKNSDGSIVAPQTTIEDFPIHNLSGTTIGGLIRMLAGDRVGILSDQIVGTIDDEFLTELSQRLKPGADAVVMDISEDWITPTDLDLEPFSTAIFRRSKIDIEDELIAKRIEANEKEIENLEQELNHAREDRKDNLKAKFDDLKQRLKQQVGHLEARKDQIQSENKAKIVSLQKKVSSSTSENKSRLQSRLLALERADLEFTNRIKSSIGKGLQKVADLFQKKAG